MGKRKRIKLFQNNVFLVLCLVLGLGFFVVFLGKNDTKVLGDHSDNDNSGWWNNSGLNNNGNNNQNNNQDNNVSATITSTVTAAVIDSVTVTSVITVDPTITDVVELPRVTITQRLQGRSAVPAKTI